MLVLSRGKNQGIRFPSLGVSVEILEMKGAKVKVGVTAPQTVRILRSELIDRPNTETGARSAAHLAANEQPNRLQRLGADVHDLASQLERERRISAEDKIDVEEMLQTVLERLEAFASSSRPPHLASNALAVTNQPLHPSL